MSFARTYSHRSADTHYSNNERLLHQTFTQYQPVLYNIALRMLGYGDDARDAVQDTFIKASTKLSTLNDNIAMGNWLMSITRNHCLMELRKRKTKERVLAGYQMEHDVVEQAHNHCDRAPKAIRDALSTLTEPVQLATMLRYYSRSNSYDEIAEALNIPVGTVRSRLSDARTKIATALQREQPNEKNYRAQEMESFYSEHFDRMHTNLHSREKMFNQMERDLLISLTSGKTTKGVQFIENEIEFDLKYGVVTKLKDVNSSGVMSVLEIDIVNPENDPNLCPLAATFIMVHPKTKTEKLYLYNSKRLFDK